MRNIKLIVAYDGTDFSGWQRQEGARTVQGSIEGALETLHRQPVPLTGSGRTDAGVHAVGQAANFYTGIAGMEAPRFVPALNSLLPPDVRIMEASEAAASFHARFDAKLRTYRYFFIAGRRGLPMETRYRVRLRRSPRLDRLNGYARLLLGETDCTLFASPRDTSRSRSRLIRQAWFFVQGDTLVFEISANAFLWKMVRTVAGTLLDWEERDLPLEEARNLIRSGDRASAGPALPPEGLFLWKVDYFTSF
ncbi:MAG: tRNA pseudouridine(38-40) synthase TruA [Spirochaetaceae bacterium]|jgi:tRNA pseudouridine38-40 synthase|nr:tRNA pseudouridine(38-40) synthase TruA [Spirochaetaceae bacterium]